MARPNTTSLQRHGQEPFLARSVVSVFFYQAANRGEKQKQNARGYFEARRETLNWESVSLWAGIWIGAGADLAMAAAACAAAFSAAKSRLSIALAITERLLLARSSSMRASWILA